MTDLLVRFAMKVILYPIMKRVFGVVEPEDSLKQGKYPLLNAMTSLVPMFGGAGQSFLGQDEKFLGILITEGLVAVGVIIIFFPLFPFIYSALKIFCAVDAFVMAKRVRSGKKIGRWEFFWNSTTSR